MSAPAAPRLETLSLAFERFNEAARLLESQQRTLQERVASLDLQLAEKNNELHNVLENLSAGVIAVGPDGRIATANGAACALLGCALDDLLGQPAGELVSQRLGTGFVSRCAAGGWSDAGTVETSLPRTGGTVRLHASPARDVRSGAPIGGILILEDITALVQWRERALLNQRLSTMGQVAAQIAHEIRNPLGSVELLASMLARETAGTRAAGIAGHIVASIRSLDSLVSNILLFARGREPEVEPVLWEDVARAALQHAGHALDESSVRVETRWQACPARVLGDADLLTRAVVNLLLNAAQAMEATEGPRVITLETAGDSGCSLRIADRGPGVPAELRERIFDPFVTTRRRGTGLGLAIVSHIVAAHGGRVTCGESERGGAVFEITLPRAEAQAEHREGTHG
ncbi:MAG: PAS domain-containing protein [Candidatus Sumerlaeia bacterium]|nr:PAS domain-containing protein [Candidatus Sumerlaeia bacterium]